MYIDFWKDEYESINTDELTELTEKYKKQVDRTVFTVLEERLEEYGIPVYESFPSDESMESFIMLDDEYRVTVRVSSEGGLVNLHMRTEVDGENVTKDEAIVKALVQVAKEELNVSRIETTYLRNKSEVSIQTLWRA